MKKKFNLYFLFLPKTEWYHIFQKKYEAAHQFSTLIIIRNVSWAVNQHIRMISEGSFDTEDWSNDAENSALITGINYIWLNSHIEDRYFKLLHYIFRSTIYCIFHHQNNLYTLFHNWSSIGGGWGDSPLLCKALWVSRKALYKCNKLLLFLKMIDVKLLQKDKYCIWPPI